MYGEKGVIVVEEAEFYQMGCEPGSATGFRMWLHHV